MILQNTPQPLEQPELNKNITNQAELATVKGDLLDQVTPSELAEATDTKTGK